MKPRVKTTLFILALLTIALQRRAAAHAFLDHSDPKVGATVHHTPKAVTVWFTQQPEHAFSTIQVFNSDGKEVDKADTHTDPNDAHALTVGVPDLPPGTYKVVWKVLSIDTHRTSGDFKFTVK